jgi:hypothetical protein fgonA2_04800
VRDNYSYVYYGGERTGKIYRDSDIFKTKIDNLSLDIFKEQIQFGGNIKLFDGPKYITSVKSIDMNAKTYLNGSGLSSKLNRDLRAIQNFAKYELKGVSLESGNIKGRVLKLVINDNPLNSSQIENLKKVVENANKSGIKVEAILLK